MRFIPRALAATAIATAMAATAGSAFAAGNPTDTDRQKAKAEAQAQHRDGAARHGLASPRSVFGEYKTTPSFPLSAVNKSTGALNLYFPDYHGGFKPRDEIRRDYRSWAAVGEVDNEKDELGWTDGSWVIQRDGKMTFTSNRTGIKDIGGGWQIYDKVLFPGNLAGAGEADIIARDKAGVLWLYLGYADGRVTARTKVGGGWGQYTEIAGQGDLDGDGFTDIVARDKAGVLWFYKGSGDRNDPFNQRTRIGGGWNTYNRILSVGDLDNDGRTDLVARGNDGTLWRYSGNGDAADPFDNRVKIGWGYNVYNLL